MMDIGATLTLPEGLTGWEQWLAEAMYGAMEEASMLLWREVEKDGRVPVGNTNILQGSIIAVPPRWEGTTLRGGLGTSNPYAEAVEIGTRPHFPPVQPLKEWVQAKLGVSQKEAGGIAFVIARKIAKHGTKGQYFFKAVKDDCEADIQAIFDRALQRLMEREDKR